MESGEKEEGRGGGLGGSKEKGRREKGQDQKNKAWVLNLGAYCHVVNNNPTSLLFTSF